MLYDSAYWSGELSQSRSVESSSEVGNVGELVWGVGSVGVRVRGVD